MKAAGRNWLYLFAILLLPALVLWYRDNALYTAPWYADPWFYTGYFRNLVEYKRDMFYGLYYGSRLSWVLPGFLVHALFPPVAANAMLHLALQSVATLSFFFVPRPLEGSRCAFLGTMVFSVCPWLWAATGWDYPDGAGIAWCLLAMAALTRSAARPARWSLWLAGVAMAGMVYTHLFLVSLAPVLVLFYLGLSWMRRRESFGGAVRGLGWWGGAGFVVLTLALCGVNYLLDGTFWFYAPSLEQAQRMSKDFVYFRSIWSNGQLEPWLWPAAAGGLTAVAMIAVSARKIAGRAADLLLALQLLLVLGWMGWLQGHGSTVLGHHPYASYLLPFVFLVFGSAYFGGVESIGGRTYVAICVAAALIFAGLWGVAYQVHVTPGALRALTIASACGLGAALVWRGRVTGTLAALAGFSCLTAAALDQTVHFRGVELHGNRAQYGRIMQARERIEAARHGRAVRFWFDQQEPYFHEYFGLNALYLAERSRLGGDSEQRFPMGCDAPVDPETLVVVTSQKQHAAELARGALRECWQAYGMNPVMEAEHKVETGGRPYTLAMLRAEADPARQRALRVVFDAAGKAALEFAANGAAAAFPRERWKLTQQSTDPASMQDTPRGRVVRTPRSEFGFAIEFPKLNVPADGRYRFALRYRPVTGQFAFGARPGDDSKYLAADATGHVVPGGREMAFWVDLRRGDEVLLRIANNSNAGDRAAEFLMGNVTAVEVDR